MTEEKQITVKAYRDKNGLPTCAADFRVGHVCQFLRLSRLGTQEVCAIEQNELLYRRGEAGIGSLIPCDKCIVWKGDL